MTVCVAAICDNGTIIGASDRMLTAGDVQFEPPQPKIIPLTASIVVMIAGDSSLQYEILMPTVEDISKRVSDEPDNWWRVQDVVDLYVYYYHQAKSKRAENDILAPLYLDRNTFIDKQKNLSSDLIKQLATELINFNMPGVETIIAGVDESGPHIFSIVNGRSYCQDGVGFASIGIGNWHSNSQFMFVGHSKHMPFAETLLLTYSAKKRAEVAPGVGLHTDMITVGPNLGSYYSIRAEILDKLEEIYQEIRSHEKESGIAAMKKVNQYVQEIIDAATTKGQASVSEDSLRDTPLDEKTTSNERGIVE